MIEFHGKLELNDINQILKEHGLDEHGSIQKSIDDEVLKRCAKYLPFQTGALMNMGILGTVRGSGDVAWIGVKPRYLYYGKVMVGSPPKKETDKKLTYNGAPLRGSHWFERMKDAEGEEIVKGVQELVDKGG